MTPAGLAVIEAAKITGAWTLYDEIEALRIPADLQQALDVQPSARSHFMALAPSTKKRLVWWVESARRAKTGERRITVIVEEAARNRQANQVRRQSARGIHNGDS
jgi:uncharacterized protein YdeI (YjbR/CyaY-like superfamily)